MRKISDLSLKTRAIKWLQMSSVAIGLFIAGCGHSTLNEPTPSPSARSDVQKILTQAQIPAENAVPPINIHRPFEIVLPVRRLKINQKFYDTRWREHLGVDLGGRWGDPIYAATPGTVVYAGSGFHGFGKMIIIAYNQKWATLYAHLNRFRVRTGRHVRAGQRIGDMGRTGHATGVHLHFELLCNKLPVNPLPYLEDSVGRPNPYRQHGRAHHGDLAAHENMN